MRHQARPMLALKFKVSQCSKIEREREYKLVSILYQDLQIYVVKRLLYSCWFNWGSHWPGGRNYRGPAYKYPSDLVSQEPLSPPLLHLHLFIKSSIALESYLVCNIKMKLSAAFTAALITSSSCATLESRQQYVQTPSERPSTS